jgi:hypothetical protein
MASRRKETAGQQSLFPAPATTKGRRRHGATGRSSDAGAVGDLDTTSARRRVHEAVTTFEDPLGTGSTTSSERSCERRPLQPLPASVAGGLTNARWDPYPPYHLMRSPAVWTGFRTAGSAGSYVNSTLNTFPYRPAPGEYV